VKNVTSDFKNLKDTAIVGVLWSDGSKSPILPYIHGGFFTPEALDKASASDAYVTYPTIKQKVENDLSGTGVAAFKFKNYGKLWKWLSKK